MNRLIKYAICLTGLFAISCVEIENPSDIPEVIYTAHEAEYCTDELNNQNKCITLSFKLKDGDGNIGLTENDTTDPFTGIYQHNFYYDVLIYKQGEFIDWQGLDINYFDIPYIEPEGQNKILIADIDIDISFPVSTLNYDTLMLSFFVYDRALNQSNTALSDTIIFQ